MIIAIVLFIAGLVSLFFGVIGSFDPEGRGDGFGGMLLIFGLLSVFGTLGYWAWLGISKLIGYL